MPTPRRFFRLSAAGGGTEWILPATDSRRLSPPQPEGLQAFLTCGKVRHPWPERTPCFNDLLSTYPEILIFRAKCARIILAPCFLLVSKNAVWHCLKSIP